MPVERFNQILSSIRCASLWDSVGQSRMTESMWYTQSALHAQVDFRQKPRSSISSPRNSCIKSGFSICGLSGHRCPFWTSLRITLWCTRFSSGWPFIISLAGTSVSAGSSLTFAWRGRGGQSGHLFYSHSPYYTAMVGLP